MSNENPAILLAGGRPRDPSYMAGLFARSLAGLDGPRVAYIGTANGDNPEFFLRMEAIMLEAGAASVTHVPLASDHPDLDAARAALTQADVIFLAGGEVEDGVYWLMKHGLTELLRDLYRAGKRFTGVSAGTIMMGSHWVRWDVPEDDSTSSLFDCLGIIPVLFDTHGEDEDWVEIIAALKLLGDGAVGYGLPGGAMISADSSGVLTNLEGEYLVFVNEGGDVRIR
ncbi:MAG: Type 1 glutamine amidotransferase-like domain-containing protein [Clostridiales bacterium]|nr:Type 1 glutamine amidotransferase-like domain-containing protein [Clostridiales bacterium]